MGYDPQKDARNAVAKLSARMTAARHDVNEFSRYIGVVTGGERPKQGPVHAEWQKLWSDHKRTVIHAPVFHAKTTQIRMRILWEIGRNPNLRVSFLSATERHPKKVLAALKQEIEDNERLHWIFPCLKPATGSRRLWTSTEILVERSSREADPTIQCFGLFGKILGSRTDLLVIDDLCNFENTLTAHAREKTAEWMGESLSRLTHDARVIALGTLRHEHDELRRLSKLPGWTYHRYAATREDEDGNELLGPDGEPQPLIEEMWNLEQIRQVEAELGPVDAELFLYNRLPPHKLGRFKQAWFDACLARGRGLHGFEDRWSGSPTYTGVDLGHRKSLGSDRTVLFTVAVLPEGTRRVLDIRSGNWSAPDILDELRDVHRRFGSILIVENNAAQNYLLEFAAELDTLPIRPHSTGMNKYDQAHGIESLGLELQQAGWMLPCDDDMVPLPEMGEAIKECLAYDPTRHPGDRLMAWWICREGIRLSPAIMGVEIQHADLLSR